MPLCRVPSLAVFIDDCHCLGSCRFDLSLDRNVPQFVQLVSAHGGVEPSVNSTSPHMTSRTKPYNWLQSELSPSSGLQHA